MIKTKLVTRKVAKSLINGLSLEPSKEPIRFEQAQKEHDEYVELCRQIVGSENVYVLEASEELPDCVFVEDPVVCIGEKVLVNKTGAVSRRNETIALADFFKHNTTKQLSYMAEIDPNATLDGGDVLYVDTTKTIFVGNSSRTNESGIKVLKQVFNDCNVVTIHVKRGLHLKSFCSFFASSGSGEAVILVSGCDIGRDIGDQITNAKLDVHHRLEFTNAVESSNVVSIDLPENRFAVIRKKGFPDSLFFKLQQELQNVQLFEIEYDELAKIDGALTCCSVLFKD